MSNQSDNKDILEKLLSQIYELQKTLLNEYKKDKFWRRVRNVIITIFFILIIFSSLSSVFLGAKKYGKKGFILNSYTATIDLNNIIDSFNKTDEIIINSLKNAYEDPKVKGIIIKANSPGGSPVLSDIIYNEIINKRKEYPNIPIYVVIDDVCASGCYYIASAADKIFANKASLVGSIGVISSSFGFQDALKSLKIERRLKIAGKNKGMGDMFSEETPEHKKIWDEMLNEVHEQFIDSVKNGRGSRLKWENNDEVFSGRIYTGNQAKEIGLIDDFGDVRKIAKDVIKAPDLVDFTDKKKLIDSLMDELGVKIKEELINFKTFLY